VRIYVTEKYGKLFGGAAEIKQTARLMCQADVACSISRQHHDGSVAFINTKAIIVNIVGLSPRRPQLIWSSFTGNFVEYTICGHNCTLLKISLRRSRRHRVNYNLNLGTR
jgi:hypothetical protein